MTEKKCPYCGAMTHQPAWMCYKAPVTFRAVTGEDWHDGFKYQANIGYKWEDVEVGKNGFTTKEQFVMAGNNFIARTLLIKQTGDGQ